MGGRFLLRIKTPIVGHCVVVGLPVVIYNWRRVVDDPKLLPNPAVIK